MKILPLKELLNNHLPNCDSFFFTLATKNNFKVTLIKSLLFNSDDLPLRKSKQSLS